MGSLWAVARHTFAQCLRMKIAGAFIVLLAAMLAVLPFVNEGDGTLAGQIRTFLDYGTGGAAFLLSVVTIFLAAGVVSGDVREQYIFTVAVKPLARWKYILGRWLGVVLLDAVLLAVSAAAIFAMAQYLRAGKAPKLTEEQSVAGDRRAVETEVFTARRKVQPQPLDLEGAVDDRIHRLREQGQYQVVLESYKGQPERRGDEAGAVEALKAELRKQEAEKMQSAGPGRTLTWRFSGIRVAGTEKRGAGKVTDMLAEANLLRIQADPALVGGLVFGGPVNVGQAVGRVERLGRDFFIVRLTRDDMVRLTTAGLGPGSQAPLVIDPVVQFQFKAIPVGQTATDTLYMKWVVRNGLTGLEYRELRTFPARMPVTLTVSARLVDDDGTVTVEYTNLAATSVTVLHSDVAVLYRVGAFAPNFARAMALVMIQLAFLAGVGIFAGSFLSFPVACLICFTVLPFSLARGFLAEAVELSNVHGLDAVFRASRYVFKAMTFLMPDLASTSPGDSLVGGLNVDWGVLGWTAAATLLARTSPFLAAACAIFHRRELARVQV